MKYLVILLIGWLLLGTPFAQSAAKPTSDQAIRAHVPYLTHGSPGQRTEAVRVFKETDLGSLSSRFRTKLLKDLRNNFPPHRAAGLALALLGEEKDRKILEIEAIKDLQVNVKQTRGGTIARMRENLDILNALPSIKRETFLSLASLALNSRRNRQLEILETLVQKAEPHLNIIREESIGQPIRDLCRSLRDHYLKQTGQIIGRAQFREKHRRTLNLLKTIDTQWSLGIPDVQLEPVYRDLIELQEEFSDESLAAIEKLIELPFPQKDSVRILIRVLLFVRRQDSNLPAALHEKIEQKIKECLPRLIEDQMQTSGLESTLLEACQSFLEPVPKT